MVVSMGWPLKYIGVYIGYMMILYGNLTLYYIYRISLMLIHLLDNYHHAKYPKSKIFNTSALKHGKHVLCFLAFYLESSSCECCLLHMWKQTGHTQFLFYEDIFPLQRIFFPSVRTMKVHLVPLVDFEKNK